MHFFEDKFLDAFLRKHHPQLTLHDLKNNSRHLQRYCKNRKRKKTKPHLLVVLGKRTKRWMNTRPCLHCRYHLCNITHVLYIVKKAQAVRLAVSSLSSLCLSQLQAPVVSRRFHHNIESVAVNLSRL